MVKQTFIRDQHERFLLYYAKYTVRRIEKNIFFRQLDVKEACTLLVHAFTSFVSGKKRDCHRAKITIGALDGEDLVDSNRKFSCNLTRYVGT